MKSKYKILVTLLLPLIFFSYLIYSNIDNSLTYYYTVSELNNLDGIMEKQLRIRGSLVKDSIIWNSETERLSCILTDGRTELHMSYQGMIPNNFDHVSEIIVEGQMSNPGQSEAQIFVVSKLMTQCPSKYEKHSAGEE